VALACTFVHVCRSTGPVDRLTDPCSRVLSVDRASRPTEQTCVFCLASGRPTGRPSPTASLPDRLPVDRAGRPTAASSPQRLVYWKLFSGFNVDISFSYFWISWGYYL